MVVGLLLNFTIVTWKDLNKLSNNKKMNSKKSGLYLRRIYKRIIFQLSTLHWGVSTKILQLMLHFGGNFKCCIFWPGFGRTLQALVENLLYQCFLCKKAKKAAKIMKTFSDFLQGKCWKSRFWTAFEMYSTQMLVEIYNIQDRFQLSVLSYNTRLQGPLIHKNSKNEFNNFYGCNSLVIKNCNLIYGKSIVHKLHGIEL